MSNNVDNSMKMNGVCFNLSKREIKRDRIISKFCIGSGIKFFCKRRYYFLDLQQGCRETEVKRWTTAELSAVSLAAEPMLLVGTPNLLCFECLST